MITSEIEMITPEKAIQYLSFNTGNRSIRPTVVESLALSIKAGEWMTSHQGIGFSASGRLVDGQHRLSAVIAAGMPINIIVTRGLPEDIFEVIDRHSKRTMTDTLRMEKKLLETATFALIVAYEKGQHKFTITQTKDAAHKISTYHDALMASSSTDAKIFSSSGARLAAITAMHIHRNNQQAVEKILKMYRDMVLCNTETFTTSMHGIYKQSLTGAIHGIGGAQSRRSGIYLRMCNLFSSLDDDKKLIRAHGKDTYKEVVKSILE